MNCPGCRGTGLIRVYEGPTTCGLCDGRREAVCEMHAGPRSQAPLAIERRFVMGIGEQFAAIRHVCAECDGELRPLTRDTVPEYVWVRP